MCELCEQISFVCQCFKPIITASEHADGFCCGFILKLEVCQTLDSLSQQQTVILMLHLCQVKDHIRVQSIFTSSSVTWNDDPAATNRLFIHPIHPSSQLIYVVLLFVRKAISPGNKSVSKGLLWKLVSLIESNEAWTQAGREGKVSRLRTFNEYWICQQHHSPFFTYTHTHTLTQTHMHTQTHTREQMFQSRLIPPLVFLQKIPKRNVHDFLTEIGQLRLLQG